MRRRRVAKALGDKIKKVIIRSGGVFERTHGNSAQSGWPAYFFYHKLLGLRWVQTLAPGRKLNWQKVARFRLWTRYGVPIYVVNDFNTLRETLEGEPNWHLYINFNTKEFEKGEERTEDIEYKLPEPPQLHHLEQQIADRIQWKLEKLGWLVQKSFGNRYQAGWPDYYLHHPEHGYKWLETKRPSGKLETTQFAKFTKWEGRGVKVWVLKTEEIDPLFGEPNWRQFPVKKWKFK